jgi:Mg2+/Co2+ transporter CorB
MEEIIALQPSIDVGSVVFLSFASLLLLIMSAMASGSEVAFFSLTHSNMDELEGRNTTSARRVIELLGHPDRLLATILVANNMVNICLVIV